MKKAFTVLTVVAFVAAFTSCKKEYECCYYDNGVKLSTVGYTCVTSKMSKKEKEDVESAAATTLTSCGTSCTGWTYECK